MRAGDGAHKADSWAEWWDMATEAARRGVRDAPDRAPDWCVRQAMRLRSRTVRVLLCVAAATILGGAFSVGSGDSDIFEAVITWLWVIAAADLVLGVFTAAWRMVRG